MVNTVQMSAVVVCGGRGRRLGAEINKVYLELGGKTILEHSLDTFLAMTEIAEIIIVHHSDDYELLEMILNKLNNDKIKLALAGKERQDSVYNGLLACDKNSDYVLIHDGARPLLSKSLLVSIIKAIKKNIAVIPVLPLVDTIKELCENKVNKTLQREKLAAAQTPQAFRREQIIEVYQKALTTDYNFTDDASIYEYYGLEVTTITGEKQNIKITTVDDIALAEFYLRR